MEHPSALEALLYLCLDVGLRVSQTSLIYFRTHAVRITQGYYNSSLFELWKRLMWCALPCLPKRKLHFYFLKTQEGVPGKKKIWIKKQAVQLGQNQPACFCMSDIQIWLIKCKSEQNTWLWNKLTYNVKRNRRKMLHRLLATLQLPSNEKLSFWLGLIRNLWVVCDVGEKGFLQFSSFGKGSCYLH